MFTAFLGNAVLKWELDNWVTSTRKHQPNQTNMIFIMKTKCGFCALYYIPAYNTQNCSLLDLHHHSSVLSSQLNVLLTP